MYFTYLLLELVVGLDIESLVNLITVHPQIEAFWIKTSLWSAVHGWNFYADVWAVLSDWILYRYTV